MSRSTTTRTAAPPRPGTTVAAALAALVIGLATVLVSAAPAAAESFRYWGYYTQDGSAWAFAQTGPADATPPDGSIEGWRFAVADETSTRLPRATPDFETLCGSTAAEDGSKRVGVVIDYGTTEDAPEGEEVPAPVGACAVVDTEASGADVVAAVADLRLADSGLVCGIDGYPSEGCGDPVDGPAPSGDEEPVELQLTSTPSAETSTSWVAIVIGVAAVAAVAVAALVVSRRRSSGSGSGSGSAA
jgi:hypothetical protein